MRSRRVQVNGNLCLDTARRLKAQEVVHVLAHPAAPLPTLEQVRIRYSDSDVVVVEKPSGLTSVPHAEERNWSAKRRRFQPTLLDLLPQALEQRRAARGPKPKRPPPQQAKYRPPTVRPVHRLDRETSGLMVFARTIPAERVLGAQFRAHTTGRTYLAVVVGTPRSQTITTTLVRDRGDGRRGSGTPESGGKRAVTHVQVVERLGEYSLVECRLETGRTHQIRIHLAEIGHPVCGEKVYSKPLHGPPLRDGSGAPRVALHAARLEFDHPRTGARLQFQMDLPADLRQFLQRLRKAGGAAHE